MVPDRLPGAQPDLRELSLVLGRGRRTSGRVATLLRLAIVVAALVAVRGAVADPGGAPVDLNAEQRAVVVQLTAELAITLANERRLSDAAQEELYRRLAAADRAARAALARAAGNAAERARVRRARDEIARQRQELIAALEQRDRALAAEVRAYRDEVTRLAASPDPEKQKALQMFADGERTRALAVLDAIADARRAAHDRAAAIADAAERRPTAWLAVQAHDAGDVTLDQLVARFEQLTRLDPAMTWDWIELARLYRKRGRLADARGAAEAAQRSATGGSEGERALVLDELGDVVVEAGDLAAAKAHFEDSLVIRRKLAHGSPTSTEAQRDLGFTLDRLGSVAVAGGDLAGARSHFEESLGIRRVLAHDSPASAPAQRDVSLGLERLGDLARTAGDPAGAKARFEECLEIRRKLAHDHPASAEAQRDLAVGLEKLGDVAVATGDLAAARAHFETRLGIARKLAHGSPTSAQAQRDVSISLNKLGDVEMAAADLTAARARFEEGLGIARRLAHEDPTSAQAQRDVDVSLDRLGTMAVAAGDITGAKARFEEGLSIVRKLAHDNPTSAEAQRDVIASLVKLGSVTRSRAYLQEALQRMQQLDRSGRLAPPDRFLLELLPPLIDVLP